MYKRQVTNLAPAIEHDGACVSETNAIARYLCAAFPEQAGKFYPGDAKARAKVDMIADYAGASVYNLIATAMYPDVGFGFGGPGAVGAVEGTEGFVPAAKAAAAAQLLELLETKFANGWLKDSPFLAGDAPTIADFRFGPVLLFARVAVKLPERVEAYVARLERDVPGYAEATEPARAFVADKIKK